MVGWHHQPNGHESEQTLGDTEGQGSLACCHPWGHQELDRTERLNNNKLPQTKNLQEWVGHRKGSPFLFQDGGNNNTTAAELDSLRARTECVGKGGQNYQSQLLRKECAGEGSRAAGVRTTEN